MTKHCEFKNRECTEIIRTREGDQTVLELIDKFLSTKEDQSRPVSACDETFNPNRHTKAFNVAEVYSTSGVFHICSKCRESVEKHLRAMGAI